MKDFIILLRFEADNKVEARKAKKRIREALYKYDPMLLAVLDLDGPHTFDEVQYMMDGG